MLSFKWRQYWFNRRGFASNCNRCVYFAGKKLELYHIKKYAGTGTLIQKKHQERLVGWAGGWHYPYKMSELFGS
jgi:hypothetical protein